MVKAYALKLFSGAAEVYSLLELKDVVDILLVAFLIYLLLLFIKQTKSFFIFNAIVFITGVIFISYNFNLTLTRQLMQPLLTFILVIFVIVFQKEIRKLFDWFSRSSTILALQHRVSLSAEVASAVTGAVEEMARIRRGSIIVIPGEYPLDDLVQGGFELGGKVSVPLLLSIFDPSSPGHDGAIIIENDSVKKFGVHLPLAEEFDGTISLGTRHRAAQGITEITDALAIVVSEERGTISLAHEGALRTVLNTQDLEDTIHSFVKENIPERLSLWRYIFLKHIIIKLVSFILAVTLWFFLVFQIGVANQRFTVPLEYRYLSKEYVVEDGVNAIEVTLSGRNSDLRTVDSKQLKAAIDLVDVKEGRQYVKLDKENISFPSYLNFIKINPEEIRINVKKI